jgi:hypothetical protein
MEQRQQTLPARSIVEVLNETFSVYGKQFRKFIGLVAVVQVPIGLAVLGLALLFGDGTASTLITNVLVNFGTVFVFGATVVAVAQHYLPGDVRIDVCYGRAWWRAMSLFLLGIVNLVLAGLFFAALASVAAVGASPEEQAWVRFLPLVLIPAVALTVYWFMSVQTVVVEGTRALGALRRSYGLIRGSWWRVFGRLLVIGLVVLGLSILVNTPLAVAAEASGADVTSTLGFALLAAGRIVVQIVVLPVLFIAGTLLYYDLRVRKEQYDLSVLSQEMGIAAV